MDFYTLQKQSNEVNTEAQNSNVLNLADFLNQKDSVFDLFGDKTEGKSEDVRSSETSSVSALEADGLDIDQLNTDIQVETCVRCSVLTDLCRCCPSPPATPPASPQ